MKALLWLLLAAATAANISTSFAFDGVKQIAVSLSTGAVVIGAAACLALLRHRDRQART
ncbi:hypothetical protein [Streptomyces sp. NPDC046939]|uniref:hypothetical protein n=1 Tax=Streptomyces sp. NPDC046939 TaxID=3155376 RepID=UPI0033E3AA8C